MYSGETKYERCPSTRLAMLDYLVERLTKNNISYAISYGTLLGAVRSQSLIPWTVDLDLAIPQLSSPKVQDFFRSQECFRGNVDDSVFHYWSNAPNTHYVHYGFFGLQSHTVYVDIYNLPLTANGKEVRVVGSPGKNTIPSYIIYPLNKKGAVIEGKWYATPRKPLVFLEAL